MATATVNNHQSADIYDEAMAPQSQTARRDYFGQVILVDVWACVLQKGVGKIAFDPMVHPASDKRVAIKISVEVQGRDRSYTVDQDTINTAKDWTRFTLPSLNAIGAQLRDLKGKYVHVERVPTGDVYTGRDGEQKDRTAIKFIEVFADEAACKAASDAFYTPRSQTHADASAPAGAAPAAAPNLAEREMLATQFLPPLWQASGKTATTFLGMIQANPLLAKHFDAQSPEIVALTAQP